MNIIFVFTYGISLKNWHETGVLSREIEVYKRLSADHGISFTFLTFGDESDEEYEYLFENLKILPIYKYINKSESRVVDFLKTIFGIKKIINLLGDFEIIKTNQLHGSWVAMIIKFLSKKPLYLRTGYNLFEFSVRNKKRIHKKIFYYLLTQVGLIYSDVYSVTSKVDELYLKKYFITKKIAIMPNWVLDVKKNEFKNRHKNRLLAVGRLESQKNFHSLINALAGSEVELDIVGVGSEKNSLKKLALQSNVKLNLIGNLEHQELTKLYLNYRVFIIPSKFEGNPKVVLEAISRGALVISKENKNISEIINDEINGVIYKDDNEILEKVNYYLGNEEVWNEIVFEAYKSLISNNIIEKYIEREISTYKNLI